MTLLARPGIYQQSVKPTRRVGGLARRDIPVLIGFTQRGPAMLPIRIESIRQFDALFGNPYSGSYLGHAVKGFFESGGQAAYIVRVVGKSAKPASTFIGESWQVSAATSTAALGIGLVNRTLLPWQERVFQRYGHTILDSGLWGNALSLRITYEALPVTDVFSNEEQSSLNAELLWSGQRVELFTNLSASVSHARYFADIINQESRYISLITLDKSQHDQMLPEGEYNLFGGHDGLDHQTYDDWIAALIEQAQEDEIALIAAPDLVRQPTIQPTVVDSTLPQFVSCDLPVAVQRGKVEAELVDAFNNQPVKDAIITVAGEGAVTQSDVNGKFSLQGLPVGIIELRISASGYFPVDSQVQSRIDAKSSHPLLLRMMPIQEVPALSIKSISNVQRAMLDPSIVGPYRVALLDPPAAEMSPERLIDWTSGLYKSARGFALAPWIGVPDSVDDRLIPCPPSGHVCGIFAAAEASQGVHRSPANHMLRHAKSVALTLDNELAAECHRLSLNLIQATPGRGIRLMGARSLSTASEWSHISVRRLFDALERTLLTRLDWAIFEPTSAFSRQILVFAVTEFLETLRRRGMFAGQIPEEAYSVRCDDDLNQPSNQMRGELIVEISVAPTHPYEFITFSLTAQAEAINVTERS